MPRGMFKSGRLRKIFVKAPGGRTRIQYRERKPSKAKCGACGKQLAGVPRELPAKISKFSKTARRPQRMFGGVLCSSCTRAYIKNKARREQ